MNRWVWQAGAGYVPAPGNKTDAEPGGLTPAQFQAAFTRCHAIEADLLAAQAAQADAWRLLREEQMTARLLIWEARLAVAVGLAFMVFSIWHAGRA